MSFATGLLLFLTRRNVSIHNPYFCSLYCVTIKRRDETTVRRAWRNNFIHEKYLVTPENIKFRAKKASLCDNKGRKQTVMSTTLTALALRTRVKKSLFRELVDGLWSRRDGSLKLALEPFAVFGEIIAAFWQRQTRHKKFRSTNKSYTRAREVYERETSNVIAKRFWSMFQPFCWFFFVKNKTNFKQFFDDFGEECRNLG